MSQITEPVFIFWTCGSLDEARRVSRFLVQERIVACANIVPWIESVFLWNDKLETCQETQVVFKTVSSQYEKVLEVIQNNTQYEVPVVAMVAISRLNPACLNWLESCLKS